MKNTNARIEWIDVAKGLSMLAIIAGHFGCPQINRLVFPWHVPIFYMVSGFFLSTKGTMSAFVSRKAKALLVPYVISGLTVVLFLTGTALFDGEALTTFKERLLALAYGAGSPGNLLLPNILAVGNIWFLEALFWGLILARIALLFSIRTGAILCMLLAATCWYSAKAIWLPFNLQSGGASALVIYTGHYLFKRTSIFQHVNHVIVAIGLIAFAIMICFGELLGCVRCSGPFIAFVASMIVVYPILVFSMWLTKFSRIKSFLLFIGENSLLVLCLHLFELVCIPWHQLLSSLPILHWTAIPARFTIPIVFSLKIVFISVGVFVFNSLKNLHPFVHQSHPTSTDIPRPETAS